MLTVIVEILDVMNAKSRKPTHLMLRYSDLLLGVDTLAEHRAVVDKKGYVWYGKFGLGAAQKVIDQIKLQISGGLQTYVYLCTGGGLTCRASLVEIIGGGGKNAQKAPERDAVPSYYRNKNCSIWVKLNNFVPVEKSDIRNLYLANDPGNSPKMNGMRALVYVKEKIAS